MPLTLSEAEDLLADYVGQNLVFSTRLNLAIERLLKAGNWSGTKTPVVFNVFADAAHEAFITLPRSINTILAGVYLNECCGGNGRPIPVRSVWYSFLQDGPGYTTDSRYRWSNGLVPVEGRYVTFADWTTPKQLRFKFETTETAGNILVRGTLDGSAVRSGAGVSNIDGISVAFTGADVTTSQTFDTITSLIKPVTNGRVYLYTWDGTTEVLVAVYEPSEKNPGWRRYRVPGCESWTEADPGQFLAICKRSYVPAVGDNDELAITNIGALRFALEALQVEDSQDLTRANEMWQQAKKLLTDEVEDDTGAGAQGSVPVNDDFHMFHVGGFT